MPRQPRIDIPGVLYHAITRGIEQREIFYDSKDKKEFLRRLGGLIDGCKVVCYAWALIPNHIHLLLSPTKTPLHTFMHRLLTGYAVYFNHRHKRCGHLFQNRYRSILCQKEVYFQQLVRYIHRNPLHAGLVTTLAELDRYPWCGHAGLMGTISCPWQAIDETLGHFGRKPGPARMAYLKYMSEDGEEGQNDLTGGGLVRSASGWEGVRRSQGTGGDWRGDERILGDGDFVEKIKKKTARQEAPRERSRKEVRRFENVLDHVSARTGVTRERLGQRCRGNKEAEARAVVAYLCRCELRMSVTEIGNRMGISQPAAGRMIRRGEKLGRAMGKA